MVLQISWLLSVPELFSAILIFLGIIIGVLSLVVESKAEPGPSAAVLIMGTGSVIGMYNFYVEYRFLFIIGLIFFAKYIEGLAGLRAYQKVIYVIKNRDLNYSQSLSYGKKFLVHIVILFFIIIFTISLISLSLVGYINIPNSRILSSIWVFVTVSYTALGLTLKYRIINETPNALFLLSLILVVVGAETYDFGSIRYDVYLYLLGIIAYSVGYWIAAWKLFNPHISQ